MNPKQRIPLSIAGILLALMVAANAFAWALRPTQRIADHGPKFELAAMVPTRFGEWREELQTMAQVVNPQQQETLDRIYSQMLTRTYVNDKGQRVMLSIAYGGDQTDAMQVHEPEVCYPAQGFQLQKSVPDQIDTTFGSIPVRRLSTNLGSRYEPVTYWVTVAGKAVRPGSEKKLEELKYGLRGQIPDGLLFRVSSIDRNEAAAFAMQDAFVGALLGNIPATARQTLSGLGG